MCNRQIVERGGRGGSERQRRESTHVPRDNTEKNLVRGSRARGKMNTRTGNLSWMRSAKTPKLVPLTFLPRSPIFKDLSLNLFFFFRSASFAKQNLTKKKKKIYSPLTIKLYLIVIFLLELELTASSTSSTFHFRAKFSSINQPQSTRPRILTFSRLRSNSFPFRKIFHPACLSWPQKISGYGQVEGRF